MRIPRSSKTLPGHWNLCTHLRPCSSWKQLRCKVCWPCVPLCLVAQLFFQVTFPSPFPKLWWSTSKRCLKRKYNSVHWLLCENLISLGVKFCLYQPIPWQKSWQSEVESDPSAAPAIPQPCSVLWAALLCSVSGDQSSSPAEGFEARQALFRSSQGLLRAGGNQMTANGLRRAWPGIKWRAAMISILTLVLCSSFPVVLGHQVNLSEQTTHIFCLQHLQQSLEYC